MKKKPTSSKAHKSNSKIKPRLRQLGGGMDEQSWLTMFAMLILAVVLCAFLVALMKSSDAFNRNDNSDSVSQAARLSDPEAREERIREIYDSIKLDESFEITREDIFGDKRAYEWDAGRTYSSSREYLRDSDVRDTKQVAKDAIEEAGFTFFDEPYAGSVASQFHFKNNRGEYVRLSVMSQNILSSSQNNRPLTEDERYAPPSLVTIKVNLDDNNE